MIARIRSLGIDWTCSAMNWSTETFNSPEGPITLSDRFGWWLEAQFGRVFNLFWSGSDEEILSALRGEVPRRYMSKRQREFAHAAMTDALKWSDFFDEFFCTDCDAELCADDEARLCSACRALHPEMLLEDRK